MDDDLFDSLLNLESDFYQEGYNEGFADGVRSGTSEGMQFGLQTGFHRFLSVGIISGRCEIWKHAKPPLTARSAPTSSPAASSSETIEVMSIGPPETGGARATKQLQVLTDLVTDIPIVNTEEAVEEFENRLKRAKARAKVVQRMLKDSVPLSYEEEVVKVGGRGARGEETIEDATTGFELVDVDAIESSSTHNHPVQLADRAALEIEIT
ncbi:hypothetical protein BZA70DRAFT_287734 [Myxozyma melibiosi]|uniref:Essential protein Yae1 N-terminal domain-containing protein n=1 Tax=Myxozyma melibiosi TaxID=54550 RepID=A0ABR1FEZ3_9ASCO